MYTLYDFLPSGNGYKVRLLLTQLGIPFTYVEKDILEGETRTDDFLKLNPNGRIPLLQLPNGDTLAESNAILNYLAEGTKFLPTDRLEKARALQWMFFEQYSHEPNIAVARFWLTHGTMTAEQKALMPEKQKGGYAALDVMEQQLSKSPYLVGGAYTIADIALYAYTHVAEEGGFDLANYPEVRAWLARVRSQPAHIPITKSPE
ncbi:glutathione S-transferase family protein [Sneathiella limimaris]|uniref:glutathione S-transferase family protein n=1 Tax=Sneathiella limimaris TaxID=1964213 RepID=UPI00146A2D6D|nr:glutathione S-transferase family protein [Sneathiella limimaris]